MKAALGVLALSACCASAQAGGVDCDEKEIADILAPARPGSLSISLQCSARLPPKAVVTRQILLNGARASGITLDCNGGTLGRGGGNALRVLVASDKAVADGAVTWHPPRDITIKNCRIEGGVRIQGMAVNGEDANLTQSSRRPGHTGRVRAAAPHDITLLDNDFVAAGNTPLYLSPGVHRVRVENSRFSGYAYSVAVYLDAESGHNTIRNNTFGVATRRPEGDLADQAWTAVRQIDAWLGTGLMQGSQLYREQIALDGSAGNLIAGNRFTRLEHGGIFLYRNCGEGGNIRHQTPTGNRLINNVFYYRDFDGSVPAIWIGSRQGDRSYCGLDQGYPLGSSASDLDHADGNLVAQNQFYKFAPARMIRDQGRDNIVLANSTVTQAIKRRSGCYFDGPPPVFLADREHLSTRGGQAGCPIRQLACDDGELRATEQPCRSGIIDAH